MSATKNKEKHNTPDLIQSVQGELERLRTDVFRSDMEKFKLFTQMLRTNAVYKKAIITHK